MGKNYSTEQRELALAYAPVLTDAIRNDNPNNQARKRIIHEIKDGKPQHLAMIICDLIKKNIKSSSCPDFHKFNALDLFKELVDTENIDFLIQATHSLLPRLAKIALHRSEDQSLARGETCLFEYSGRLPTSNKDQPGHFPLWERNFFVFLLEMIQIWSGDFPNFSLKYKSLPQDYKQLYRALLAKQVTFPTEFTFMIPPLPVMPPPPPILPAELPLLPPTLPLLPPTLPIEPPIRQPSFPKPSQPPAPTKDFKSLKAAVSECIDNRNNIADLVMANPYDPNLEFFFEIYENAAKVLQTDPDLADLGSSNYQPRFGQLLQDVDREKDVAQKMLAAKHAFAKTKDPSSFQSQVVQIFQRKLNKRLYPLSPPPLIGRPEPQSYHQELPPPPPVVQSPRGQPLPVPQSRIAESGIENSPTKRFNPSQSGFAYEPGQLNWSMSPEKVRKALDGPILTLDRVLVQETVDKTSRCELEVRDLKRENAILKQRVKGLERELQDCEQERDRSAKEAASVTQNNEVVLGEVVVLRGRRDDLKDKLVRKREELIGLKNDNVNYGKESSERRSAMANTVEMLKKLEKLKEVELARYKSKFKQLERDYGQNLQKVTEETTAKRNLLKSDTAISASVIDRTYRDVSPLNVSQVGLRDPGVQPSISHSHIQKDVERLVTLRGADNFRPSISTNASLGRGEGAQVMSDLNRDIENLIKRTELSHYRAPEPYRSNSPYGGSKNSRFNLT